MACVYCPAGAGASVALCSHRCIWNAPLSEKDIGEAYRGIRTLHLLLFFEFRLSHCIVLDPDARKPQRWICSKLTPCCFNSSSQCGASYSLQARVPAPLATSTTIIMAFSPRTRSLAELGSEVQPPRSRAETSCYISGCVPHMAFRR